MKKKLKNKHIRIGIFRGLASFIAVLLVMMLPGVAVTTPIGIISIGSGEVLAATETLAPDGVTFTLTSLTGAYTDVDESPDTPDGTTLAATSLGVNTSVLASFPTPSGNPTVGAGQVLRAFVKQADEGQTGIPQARIDLYENGVELAQGTLINVPNGGTIISLTWNASLLSNADGSGVEAYVYGAKASGGPTVKNSVDVDAIEWNVTYTDTIAPTYTVAANSLHAAGDTIVLTFDEPMNTGTITDVLLQADTNITLDYDDDGADLNQVNIVVANATVVWTGGDTVATITLDEATDGAYIPDLKYVGVTLVSVTDVAGNPASSTEVYTSAGIGKETGAPTATLSPTDGATSVGINDNLVLSFDEIVNEVASGVITIYRSSDDNVFETFTITDAKVTGTGTPTITINPSGTFANSTLYYVMIDNTSFADLVGNAYAGITVKGNWDFTTAVAPSITNDPTSFAFGTLAEGSTTSTGLTYFTVTNNSAFAVNITIGGTDMTGGTAWTLSDTATPGSDTYGLKAGLEGGSYSVVVPKTGANTLITNLAGADTTRRWGLQLLAPTTFTGGGANSGTVTLTATAY